MPYIRNNKEVSRSAFWDLLKLDLADPETGELLEWDYDDAKQMLIKGEEISAGRHYDAMSTYRITNK